MCLRVINRDPNNLRYKNGKPKFKNGKMTAYKVLQTDYAGGLRTPYRHTTVEPGWLIAQGPCRGIYNIKKGAIHVYKDKKSVYTDNVTTIPVTCLEEDFIASGIVDIAFKKIYISKRNYNKALKKVKKIR